ncbi:ATP-binding cassette domain-containing protein, partial [Ruminococcus callidus]|uniref:ATP-binding cassette domain-containing protein n=1 Tax=Ruminococcus callidus TaxID=40519 RepID=UPI0023F74AC5
MFLEIQQIKKHFGEGESRVDVLRGIDISIEKGEICVLLGPSGSGKSTFLRSLNLLEVPTGGKILFEGTDITDPKVDINRHRQK